MKPHIHKMATVRIPLLVCMMALLIKDSLAGLLNSGERLNIRDGTRNDDIHILRQQLRDDCKVKYLDVRYVGSFDLTSDDIDVLSRCPLVSMFLFGSACLSPSAARELYKLSTLEFLGFKDCTNQKFVITSFPASLVHLRIEGLTKHNFHLSDSDWRNLTSFRKLEVRHASMCCPDAMIQTFGQDLPEVECKYHVGHGRLVTVICGLSDDGTSLAITTPRDTAVLRQQLRGECRLNKLFVELPSFVLTKQDVDILAR